MMLLASSDHKPVRPQIRRSLTDVDQSVNMRLLGFAGSDLYRHQIGIHYFLHRNPQEPKVNQFALALNFLNERNVVGISSDKNGHIVVPSIGPGGTISGILYAK